MAARPATYLDDLNPAQREAVDTRNRADQLLYQVEKTLTENAAKLSDTE